MTDAAKSHLEHLRGEILSLWLCGKITKETEEEAELKLDELVIILGA